MSVLLETKNLPIKTPQIEDFDNLYALQADADVMEYIGQGVRAQSEVWNGLEKRWLIKRNTGLALGVKMKLHIFMKNSCI